MSKIRIVVMMTALAVAAMPIMAEHSWNNYHWASKTHPFTLSVGDNVHAKWDSYLDRAVADWNSSKKLDMVEDPNFPLSNPKRCTSTTGKIEVCAERYGRTGWLGVAGIWASGDHITKAYTKVNDTYFDTAKYDTYGWRSMVMCQELGHDFGLGHVNETFDDPNTGSCMDYTNDPDRDDGAGPNYYPNAHDYDWTDNHIYAHTDSTTTVASIWDIQAQSNTRVRGMDEILANAGQWGTPVNFDSMGRPNVFVLYLGENHEGHDEKMITHVFWAPVDPFGEEPVPGRERTR